VWQSAPWWVHCLPQTDLFTFTDLKIMSTGVGCVFPRRYEKARVVRTWLRSVSTRRRLLKIYELYIVRCRFCTGFYSIQDLTQFPRARARGHKCNNFESIFTDRT
jgi:hypothetical protein